MTIILFVVVLFFLILVHELGHFLTAKWAKMRVDEFAIGFPPRLFAIKKDGTEYSINLLPIGGYVKIFGENGASAPDSPVSSKARDRRSERSEAGEGGQNDASKTDNEKAFGSRPRYQQAIVLLAGIAMNILVAWLIFFGVALVGTPTAVMEGSPEAGNASLTVTTLLPDSPAARAGIPLGSKITRVESGEETLDLLTPSAFTNFINIHSDSVITIEYSHKGEGKIIALAPESGVIEGDTDRKVLGLATVLVTSNSEDPLTAFKSATARTYNSLVAITVGIISFFASAFTLSADIEQVTGPIGIAGMVGDAAEFGFISLLIFTAFISLNLAVINLLPIPALDGGRLLFVVAEAVLRRPIDPEWMGRVNFIGFTLLILLMVVVAYNDIVRLL